MTLPRLFGWYLSSEGFARRTDYSFKHWTKLSERSDGVGVSTLHISYLLLVKLVLLERFCVLRGQEAHAPNIHYWPTFDSVYE